MPALPPMTEPMSATRAFLHGLQAAATSVFLFVVTVTYVGYGALCHDFGFSLGWAQLSTLLMWAAPAQVILVAALGSGAPLIETAITVGLSSVRLLPMVVALLPLIRGAHTPAWRLVLPAHFIAVSMWVEAMRLAPGVPREHRLLFCSGIGTGLLTAAMTSTLIGFYLSALLPAVFAAAAIFVTPMSFLLSIVRNSRTLFERLAFVLALVIGPLLALSEVKLDLLWTGIIAGTLAYAVHRARMALS